MPILYLKQIALILTIGVGIGFLIPMIMLSLPIPNLNKDKVNSQLLANDDLETKHNGKEISIRNDKYYAKVDEGKLTVVQGDPQSSNIIVTDIDISNWPKTRQDLITQREYNSLDEIQSFIDSMSEELRSE